LRDVLERLKRISAKRMPVKRIPISRLTRLALTVLLGGTVLLCLAMLVRALMLPAEISGSRAVFEYEQNAKMDYTVGLHPNPLYDRLELGPGIAYFLNLITDIRVHATYSLRTDRPIPVECVYTLTGTLRVYDTNTKEGVVIWSRPYTLIEDRSTHAEGGQLTLGDTVAIDVHSYLPILTQIEELTEVKPARAVLILEWHTRALTTEGIPIGEGTVTTLEIPVGAKCFTIAGEPTAKDKGSFTVADVRKDPRVMAERRTWGIWLAVSAAFLWCFVTFTTVSLTEKKVQAVNAALKKAGSRLVRSLTPEPAGGTVIDMCSIDDLLRVADELGKPVVLITQSEENGANLFYVIDGETRYQYVARF
jgi:hypothetical protein